MNGSVGAAGGFQNLSACQNTGSSAVHLDCRPDIITVCHLAPRQDCFTSAAPVFSLSLFIIHREVCESVITASLWLSQPCYAAICMADLLKTTTFECRRCSGSTLADTLG